MDGEGVAEPCSTLPVVSRRRALSLGVVAAVGACAGCMYGSSSDDLVLELGPVEPIRSVVRDEGVMYVPTARAYIVEYPVDLRDAARDVYPQALHASIDLGLLALWQSCPHMGCRVPQCPSSGGFECPCHGAKFSGLGEFREGPAPRGMDMFAMWTDGPNLRIDVRKPVEGLARTIDVSKAQPQGPACV